jgi:hypothetical protein
MLLDLKNKDIEVTYTEPDCRSSTLQVRSIKTVWEVRARSFLLGRRPCRNLYPVVF